MTKPHSSHKRLVENTNRTKTSLHNRLRNDAHRIQAINFYNIPHHTRLHLLHAIDKVSDIITACEKLTVSRPLANHPSRNNPANTERNRTAGAEQW